MYCPEPMQHDEPEHDEEAEAILRHRMEFIAQGTVKQDDNITLFPPLREVSGREINRMLGRRNPSDTVPITHRNHAVYRQYESAGFKELGQTGWLHKGIASIYTMDGTND